jgi:hemerythrin superfamily protein
MGITSTLKHATKSAVAAFKPTSGTAAADILDSLKKDHDEVKSLLSSLEAAESARERRSLVSQIKAALIPHTKAEEKVVYDAVIALKDKDAQTDGHEGYLEHEWAAKTLQRLAAIESPTSPEHKATAKVLKELVEHHIEEEESAIWDDVRENFDAEKRERMNAAFEAAKARVKVN